MGARKWIGRLDMYRKVPVDLMEGSKAGSYISWIALLVIFVLFYKETRAFFATKIVADMILDKNFASSDRIRAYFNITMMDLNCDYVQMDVVSVLGNNQNVTKFITKEPIDANGVLSGFRERNKRQNDVEEIRLLDPSITKSIEELHEDGEDAISLDEKTLQYALDSHDLVFVDMFASWCSHCRALAPTWESLAKIMADAAEESVEADEHENDAAYKAAVQLNLPVFIAKIDCVVHHDLCLSQKITGYPTLRLFVKGNIAADYRGHRTLTDLVQFLKLAEEELGRQGKLDLKQVGKSMKKLTDMPLEEQHWVEALERTRKHHDGVLWNPRDHPGCQVSGSILLNRVPGNFYIQASSPTLDLAPHMTNVSHEVHSLFFTPEHPVLGQPAVTPSDYKQKIKPMDGNVYVTSNLHEAYHHYLKLVTTNGNAYQVLQSSQLAMYRNDQVPEAKFLIDLSPIALRYKRVTRPWYDYLTSLMAIIGGTFTVVGFFASSIREVTRESTRRKSKAMGRTGQRAAP